MHFANESNLSFIKQQQLRSHGNFRDTRKTIASNCEEFRVGLWWLKSSPDLIRIQSRLTRKHIEIHVTSCYGPNDPMVGAVNFPLVCKYLGAVPRLFFLVLRYWFQDMSPVTYFTIFGMPKCGIQSIFFAIKGNSLALFRRFMWHERCQQNALKFDIFLDCEIFQFCNYWMPCPILEFIMGEKLKNKQTKTTLVFILQKYGKFWSVLEGHFIKHTPSDSEKCFTHFTNKRPQVLCFVYLERYTSTLNFF